MLKPNRIQIIGISLRFNQPQKCGVRNTNGRWRRSALWHKSSGFWWLFGALSINNKPLASASKLVSTRKPSASLASSDDRRKNGQIRVALIKPLVFMELPSAVFFFETTIREPKTRHFVFHRFLVLLVLETHLVSPSMRLQWLQLKNISWSSWHLGCLGSPDGYELWKTPELPALLLDSCPRYSQVKMSRQIVHQLKRMYVCMYVYIYNLQSNIDYVYPLGGHFCKFNHHFTVSFLPGCSNRAIVAGSSWHIVHHPHEFMKLLAAVTTCGGVDLEWIRRVISPLHKNPFP